MKNRNSRFLKIHGCILMVLGIVMTVQTVLGSFQGVGPLKFIYADALRSVGLFEAYLLAAFSGGVLILLSGRIYRKEWHLLGAVIHLILMGTNLLFWRAYAQAGIITIGYVATISHALFITLEISCYFLQKNSKKSIL